MLSDASDKSRVQPKHILTSLWRNTASVVLFTVTIFLCLLAAELAGRAYIARISERMPVDFSAYQTDFVHQYDPKLGWTMRPDLDVSLQTYRLKTNSQGLRNAETQAPTGQVRILALGDSRTYGEGTDNESTWPALLEKKLNEYIPGKFEVINAGVSGYNAFQGLRYLQTRGMELKPNLVIAAFGVNEWGKVEPGCAGWLEWEDLSAQWGIEALFRGAVKGCSALLSPPPLGPREFRISPGEYVDTLNSMQKLCRSQGAAFAILHLPSAAEIGITDASDFIFRVKRLSEGIAGYCFAAFWDPTTLFSVPAESYYVDPFHFSAAGNERIAACLFDKIITTNLF